MERMITLATCSDLRKPAEWLGVTGALLLTDYYVQTIEDVANILQPIYSKYAGIPLLTVADDITVPLLESAGFLAVDGYDYITVMYNPNDVADANIQIDIIRRKCHEREVRHCYSA